jgi:Mg-chelatase subunit ChlD
MPNPLLTPELLRRLEQFQLLATRRAKSSAKGERRSRARGQSVEFADYRTYVHGDDFRYLDWNLYGRLERLFLKLYEEERELPVRIFLDASESMAFGEPRKFDFARQIAAAIGYVALSGFDRVSVIPFPSLDTRALSAPGTPNSNSEPAARGALRSVRGKKSTIQFFQNLSGLTAGGAANLNEALRRGALEARQAGVAVVLSDFLDPEGYESGLTALVARGFQVDLVQILAPEELSPTAFGDLRLVDSETGAAQEVTFGRYRMKSYQHTVQAFLQRLREFCRGRGINFFTASSNTPLEELLLKQLRKAEVWG